MSQMLDEAYILFNQIYFVMMSFSNYAMIRTSLNLKYIHGMGVRKVAVINGDVCLKYLP